MPVPSHDSSLNGDTSGQLLIILVIRSSLDFVRMAQIRQGLLRKWGNAGKASRLYPLLAERASLLGQACTRRIDSTWNGKPPAL